MNAKTAVCPECGRTVNIVTVRQGGPVTPGVKARALAIHDHPDWPGSMCPGAMTRPPQRENGVDRCFCGCKYWTVEGRCIDCGGTEVES